MTKFNIAIAAAIAITTATAAPVLADSGFVQVGGNFGNVHNAYAAGSHDQANSYNASGALKFNVGSDAFALKLDYSQNAFLSTDTGGGQTSFIALNGSKSAVPQFFGRQGTLEARGEYALPDLSDVYIGAAYLTATNNYGYPTLHSVGLGIERLPQFDSKYSVYGSLFYYGNARGTFVQSPTTSYALQYGVTKYDIGVNYGLGSTRAYAYGGFAGDDYSSGVPFAADETHAGPYAGLGLKF